MNSDWEERRENWKPQPDDARTPFDVDYARVVHSASFRRLQGKTQILNLGDSDFYRTRLTHSLEVAQIAAGIAKWFGKIDRDHPAKSILPSMSMIQAIGFTHDLGHAPFGHGGEIALNYCMRKNKGFEANGQTLRILSRLENFSKECGSNLTRRSLLGLLKYPAAYSTVVNPQIVADMAEGPTSIRIIDRTKSKPPKCFLDSEKDVVDWILRPLSDKDRGLFQSVQSQDGKHSKTLHKSFDCSIMDVADDIAYGVHDLEDAIALGLISENKFRDSIKDSDCSTFLDALKSKNPDESENNIYDQFVSDLFRNGDTRKRAISRLVHHFITNANILEIEQFEEPLIRYRVAMSKKHSDFLEALKGIVANEVIKSPNVQHLEFKGQKMVVSVFEAFESDPKSFLPSETYQKFIAAGSNRIICDYVAGMTDGFLLKTYDRLFSPRMGSIFDRL